MIDRFSGPNWILSNFALIPVTLYSTLEEGWITYATAEHAFNAAKTLNPDERRWVADAPSDDPGEAKRRGRRVTLRPGWDTDVRYRAMAAIIAAKFTPASTVASFLLGTGEEELVEGNTWHDNHWGDCRCGRAVCAPAGFNHLGQLLMEHRALLRTSAGPAPR
ncbi:NADAR family protein [Nonomuraea ceibae]|uniref:NADAR family protein n=1 Tax=Nonomuraea ceibae TaxID=1935170 RepID=UPI001C5EF12E|nr:NADAR family protein [Nonomuraea ceibae]